MDESGNVVEATNYTDLGTLGYTGGIWSNATVDWPCMYPRQSSLFFSAHSLIIITKQQKYFSTPYLQTSLNGSNETPVFPLNFLG